jgi:hypothetical protein
MDIINNVAPVLQVGGSLVNELLAVRRIVSLV